jgi:hypothetical protein
MIPRKGLRTSKRGRMPRSESCFATSYPMKPVAPVTRTFSMDLFLLCGFGYDSNHPDWNRQCLLIFQGR